jgi:hypothetical protein
VLLNQFSFKAPTLEKFRKHCATPRRRRRRLPLDGAGVDVIDEVVFDIPAAAVTVDNGVVLLDEVMGRLVVVLEGAGVVLDEVMGRLVVGLEGAGVVVAGSEVMTDVGAVLDELAISPAVDVVSTGVSGPIKIREICFMPLETSHLSMTSLDNRPEPSSLSPASFESTEMLRSTETASTLSKIVGVTLTITTLSTDIAWSSHFTCWVLKYVHV